MTDTPKDPPRSQVNFEGSKMSTDHGPITTITTRPPTRIRPRRRTIDQAKAKT